MVSSISSTVVGVHTFNPASDSVCSGTADPKFLTHAQLVHASSVPVQLEVHVNEHKMVYHISSTLIYCEKGLVIE